MAKKKAHKKKSTKKTTRKTTTAPQGNASMIAVYVILGILVVGTSFYIGYLVGKGGDMGGGGSGTQTGSESLDKLTIIEYSDFQCPFCTRAVPTVAEIKENYDNVEVIYKHFPLESIHPNAFDAAVASECVREEGGEEAFWTYHDTLFENQAALDVTSLKSYASDQGLDIDSCLDDQDTAATVRADMDEARSRGVSGTPSFWVHDELIVGAQPYSVVSAKIDEKLSGNAAPAPAPAPTPAPAAPPSEVDLEDGNYVLGDADAPVTIIEFTDYQCPFCKRAHDQSFPGIKEYIDAGDVRYTVRHFPLPIHNDAIKASEAAECAGKVGGNDAFWAYHDSIFVNQASLGVPALKGYAADQGLDSDAFDTCLDSGEFSQLVQDDIGVGRASGVGGTPSFFVNGKILVGAQPLSAFQTAIDAELN